jgi:hypothetical protein
MERFALICRAHAYLNEHGCYVRREWIADEITRQLGGEPPSSAPGNWVHDFLTYCLRKVDALNRTTHIQEQLAEHFVNASGLAVTSFEPDAWRCALPDLGFYGPFGWAWPIPDDRPDEPAFMVRICPEIIDEQTAGLPDEDLNRYLLLIEFVCDSHVYYWFDEPDVEARHRKIEDELHRDWSTSLDRWSSIQLQVLDSQSS